MAYRLWLVPSDKVAERLRFACLAFLYSCRVVHISFSTLTYPKLAGIFKEFLRILLDDSNDSCLQAIVESDSVETITFYWKVSSEQGGDYLQFYIDDTLKDEISGEVGWQQKSYPVDAGIRILKWRGACPESFRGIRDGSGYDGGNCGWVDFVQWTGPSPAQDTSDWQEIAYKHDVLGRRVEKKVDGYSTRYVYDGPHVIAEYDGNNNLLRKYIYGPCVDEPICMIEVADSNATYYYHYDALGSVVALSDSSGDTVQTYEYSVFGEVAVEDANHPNPYMFAGVRFDIEIGLYYNRARYYNPFTGRFLQTDPVGYEDSMNMYAYCLNSPINAIDPFGSLTVRLPIIIPDPMTIARYIVRAGNAAIRHILPSLGFTEQRLQGWEEALTLFSMWVNETTDEVTLGRGNALVEELMYTDPIQAARADFYEKNYGKPLDEWEEVPIRYDFGLIQAITPEDSLNPALHFLGSFEGVITPRTTDDGEDTITITNKVSWESYWRILDKLGFSAYYNLISHLKVIDDMDMTITWTEKVAPPPWPPSDPDE